MKCHPHCLFPKSLSLAVKVVFLVFRARLIATVIEAPEEEAVTSTCRLPETSAAEAEGANAWGP